MARRAGQAGAVEAGGEHDARQAAAARCARRAGGDAPACRRPRSAVSATGEPELERDVSPGASSAIVERPHTRQVASQVASQVEARQKHRCRPRPTRSTVVAASYRDSEGRAEISEGGAGGSMLLNQMPVELLENVLSCLVRGPRDSDTNCCAEEASSAGPSSPLPDGGSPPEATDHGDVSSCKASTHVDMAPVQLLLGLCARTCRRWSKAVRSPHVLGKLSLVRLPLPAAPAASVAEIPVGPTAHVDAASTRAGTAARSPAAEAPVAGAVPWGSVAVQARGELLDVRVETLLRAASKAGNDGAQFLLGLYLSRQKTFMLLCLACPPQAAPTPDTEGQGGEASEAGAARRMPAHGAAKHRIEVLREAVLQTYEEGVQLLRSAAELGHPNALYQLGMLAFGGTHVKLRARLFGHDGSLACGDCVLAEEHAEHFWRRAAELGHLESRLIVDADFRLTHLQELEEGMQAWEADRRSWRLCAGNRLLAAAKRPQGSATKARECSHDDCGMYTLLCEFKQCAGCASTHKKQRYCNRACQKLDWSLHRASCGWFSVQ